MNKNMSRHRLFSTISDEELAMVLSQEYKDRPEDFSSLSSSCNIVNSKEFISNTSGRGIKPLLKWL